MKKISRSKFLKKMSLLTGGTVLLPLMTSPLFSKVKNSPLFDFNSIRDTFNDKILVIVNLNGGNDGLNTVIPYQNDSYYNLRPNISIPSDTVLPITDELGLHPALTHLANYWNQGKLCIIENVGYANQNLSHFRSTDIWQSGSSSNEYIETGWIARLLEQIYPNHTENLPETPMSLLQGTTNNLLIRGELGITGIMVDDPSSFLNLVNSTYYNSSDNIIPDTLGGEELQFVRDIDNAAFQYAEYIQNIVDVGTNTVEYANNPLSIQLSSAAKLISGGMYSPFYIVYQSGYDTHSNQINRHGELMTELSSALNNFYSDLNNQGLSENVVIVTTSEFGRRPYQNGSNGTDHGASAPLILLGNTVNGGIIGSQPDFNNFDNNENLLHEYDFRQIYSSVLSQHFDISSEIIEETLLGTFDTLDIITNTSTQLGDVNFDGELNVIDIVIMVNFILDVSEPSSEEFQVADINGDGSLDVLDVVSAVGIILGDNSSQRIDGSLETIEINQLSKSMKIKANDFIGGIEVHFKNECILKSTLIDNNWVARCNNNKFILYSNDLKLMKKDFIINFSKFSSIDRVIVSDKYGNRIKSRIYK